MFYLTEMYLGWRAGINCPLAVAVSLNLEGSSALDELSVNYLVQDCAYMSSYRAAAASIRTCTVNLQLIVNLQFTVNLHFTVNLQFYITAFVL